MILQENKISLGLTKLIASNPKHFATYPEVFIDNPTYVNTYFDLFYHAQLSDIANQS